MKLRAYAKINLSLEVLNKRPDNFHELRMVMQSVTLFDELEFLKIDGSDLVIEAITNAPNHLNEGGKFFFPVLSLSNSKKIVKAASETFTKVQRISHKEWRLPDELKLAELPSMLAPSVKLCKLLDIAAKLEFI